MIVLDEQLQGQDLERNIAEWYRGAVILICDLRPGTIIKDDAIPQLLRKEREPTFVTINTVDFWQKAPADRKYCIVCFAIRDTEVSSIPSLLRQLLTREGLRTKRERSGHVFRVTLDGRVRFYRENDQQLHEVTL